jgi:hypothetical protein
MRDRIPGFPLHVRKAHISDAEIQAAVEEARKFLDNDGFFISVSDKRRAERRHRIWAAGYIRRRLALVEDLPRYVGAYIDRMLLSHPGERQTYRERNRWIVRAILITVKSGFAATRNEASQGRRESACSIVAAALAQLDIDMSERTVEDIWNSYRRRTAVREKRRAAVREKQRPKSRTTT